MLAHASFFPRENTLHIHNLNSSACGFFVGGNLICLVQPIRFLWRLIWRLHHAHLNHNIQASFRHTYHYFTSVFSPRLLRFRQLVKGSSHVWVSAISKKVIQNCLRSLVKLSHTALFFCHISAWTFRSTLNWNICNLELKYLQPWTEISATLNWDICNL